MKLDIRLTHLVGLDIAVGMLRKFTDSLDSKQLTAEQALAVEFLPDYFESFLEGMNDLDEKAGEQIGEIVSELIRGLLNEDLKDAREKIEARKADEAEEAEAAAEVAIATPEAGEEAPESTEIIEPPNTEEAKTTEPVAAGEGQNDTTASSGGCHKDE